MKKSSMNKEMSRSGSKVLSLYGPRPFVLTRNYFITIFPNFPSRDPRLNSFQIFSVAIFVLKEGLETVSQPVTWIDFLHDLRIVPGKRRPRPGWSGRPRHATSRSKAERVVLVRNSRIILSLRSPNSDN